ncbi:MAG: hypothetical protein ACXV2B_05610 [Halobacteriota archaeon]
MPKTFEDTIREADEQLDSPYVRAQKALAQAIESKAETDELFKAHGLKMRDPLMTRLNSVIDVHAHIEKWSKDEKHDVKVCAYDLAMKHL